MKRIFFILIALLLFLSGCSKAMYTSGWDQFCINLETKAEVSLDKDEKAYILSVLNKGGWVNDLTDCASDYVFYTEEQNVRYHSSCGTFNDITNKKSLSISDEEREKINQMLKTEAISDPDNKEFNHIKECYYQYLKDNGMLDEKYGPASEDDLYIQTYVGKFGDCVVAYMGGDALSYFEAERVEQYGENTIIFRNGQICYAFYKNSVYTIGQAYEKGFLTDIDILKINEAIGVK